MKAGLYIRVSTDDKGQDYTYQETALKHRAISEGWDYKIYADRLSAYQEDTAENRPGYIKLLADAKSGNIDIIMVHIVDRFSREPPTKVMRIMDDITRVWKRRFISINEGLDSNNPMWEPLMAVMSWMANNYSRALSNRVKQGIAVKKAKGEYNGGRPGIPKLTEDRILEIVGAHPGISLRQIRALMPEYRTKTDRVRRVSVPTIMRVLHKHGIKKQE